MGFFIFKGAFWGLMAGMVVGLIRMIMDFVWTEAPCGEIDNRPIILKNVRISAFFLC